MLHLLLSLIIIYHKQIFNFNKFLIKKINRLNIPVNIEIIKIN